MPALALKLPERNEQVMPSKVGVRFEVSSWSAQAVLVSMCHREAADECDPVPAGEHTYTGNEE